MTETCVMSKRNKELGHNIRLQKCLILSTINAVPTISLGAVVTSPIFLILLCIFKHNAICPEANKFKYRSHTIYHQGAILTHKTSTIEGITICGNSSRTGKIIRNIVPDSKVRGANMGPIRGRQDPGGPYVGPMNFAIWGICPDA